MMSENIEDLQSLVSTSPIGICILNAATLEPEMVNDAFLVVAGKPYEAFLGKYYWDALPESAPYYAAELAKVVKDGKPFYADEAEVMLVRQGKEEWVFVTFVYMPLKDKQGTVTKVVVWVIENTTRVKERHTIQELNEELTAANEELRVTNEELSELNEELAKAKGQLLQLNDELEEKITERTLQLEVANEELSATNEELLQTQHTLQQLNDALEDRVTERTSELTLKEAQLQGIFEQAPLAFCVFKGQDLVIELANDKMLALWGKSDDVIGKPYADVRNEAEAVPFLKVLDNVYSTGIPFTGNEVKAYTTAGNADNWGYFNLTYQPLRDEQDQVTGVLAIVDDVTERVKLKKETEQVSDQLLMAIKAAKIGVWHIQPDTKALEYNATLADIFGYNGESRMTYEDAIGQVTDEYRLLILEAIEQAIRDKGDYSFVYSQRRFDDNKLIWLKSLGKIMQDSDGAYTLFSGVVIEITEQVEAGEAFRELNKELSASNEDLLRAHNQLQKAEVELLNELKHRIALSQSLEEREAWFRNIIKQAPIAIAIFSGPEFRIELYNKKVLEYWGRTAAEVHHIPLFTALPEASGQGFEDLLTNVLLTGERLVANELPVTLVRNGALETTWINFIYDPVKDSQGNIEGIIVVCNEVTDQVIARKKIKETEERLQLAIDATELGIWAVDYATRVLTLTERSRQLHGLKHDEVITLEESFNLIDDKYRQRVIDAINNAVELRTILKVEYIIHPLDGSAYKWLRATGKCIYDGSGVPLTISGTMLDITEQKKDDERKNDFIGMVSHELKTPLTSLSAYMQIVNNIAKAKEDNMAIAMLDRANKQVTRMNTLINGFLNVSRLESGKIQIDKEPVDIALVIKEVEEEVSAMNTTHQLVFAPVDSFIIYIDKDKIGQVLNNLISNAMKYSPKGSIIYIASIVAGSFVQVSVQDEGIGIAPEDQEKLFDRYYRVESNLSKIVSGFGIGLYLSAEIVQRHNGRIWVESEINKGSTFYFTIPVDQ